MIGGPIPYEGSRFILLAVFRPWRDSARWSCIFGPFKSVRSGSGRDDILQRKVLEIGPCLYSLACTSHVLPDGGRGRHNMSHFLEVLWAHFVGTLSGSVVKMQKKPVLLQIKSQWLCVQESKGGAGGGGDPSVYPCIALAEGQKNREKSF